jgi:hypothetical protein
MKTKSRAYDGILSRFYLAPQRGAWLLNFSAGQSQVVYQDDHGEHHQDVNKIATEVADESD